MTKERKHFILKIFVILFLLFKASYFSDAMDLSSSSFIVRDPVIGTFGGFGTSTDFQLVSSGNMNLSGVGSSASYQTRYGFLYYAAPATAGTITFDLDTSVADAETDTPYSVALGAVTTTDTRVSGSTDSVNMIIAEGETNATTGMVVTVRNSNGSNGMTSTSVPADNINSADGTMADGTENYGLCVITSTLSGYSRASPYDSGSCATNSETNDIQGLTSTGESILNSAGAPLVGGHAEISVNAAISGVTPAHNDYNDTLTFIATGTF
jgi:hypothetical protein